MDKFQELYLLKNKATQHITKKKFTYAMVYLCDTLKDFERLVEEVEDADLMEKLIQEIKIPSNKNLSLCYLKQGNYAECIAQCNQVLQAKPNEVKILFRLGTSYMNLGNFDEAEKHLRRAFMLDPNQKQIMQALERLQNLRSSRKQNTVIKPSSFSLVAVIKFMFLWPFFIAAFIFRAIFSRNKSQFPK